MADYVIPTKEQLKIESPDKSINVNKRPDGVKEISVNRSSAASGPFSVRISDTNAMQVIVGGGVQPRSTAAPGIIWVDSKKAVLSVPDTVTVTYTDTTSLLLTVWVDSTQTAANVPGTFYNYSLLKKAQAEALTDWKDGDKRYFPLAWITLEQIKGTDDATNEWTVSDIKWIETGWILQGGAEPDRSAFPARITGVSGGFHLCSLYANGIHAPATANNQILYFLQLAYGQTVPTGTWVLATQSMLNVTGGPLVP